MLPHQPFVARLQDYRYYYENITPPRNPPNPSATTCTPTSSAGVKPAISRKSARKRPRRARAAYWALVHRMDALIGQIAAALRENDLEQNTLVLYTSDHGEQVGEHGLWWKQTFYEDSVKVPAILAWPGRLPAGTRCSRVISSLDPQRDHARRLGLPSPAQLAGP